MDTTFWQAVELDRPGSDLFDQFKRVHQALVMRLKLARTRYQKGQQIDHLSESLLEDIGVSRLELRFTDAGNSKGRV
jgi:uncharacterized protein YjiS (DUF1127 family)